MAKAAKKKSSARKQLEDNNSAGWECLEMVKEALESIGTDMSSTPPMFYPEAILSTVFRFCGLVRSGELVYDEAKKSWRRYDGNPLGIKRG